MNKKATFVCGGEMVPASRFRVHPVARLLAVDGWETDIIHGYGPWDQRINWQFARRSYRAACRLRRAVRTAFLQRQGPVLVQRLAWPWLGEPEARLARRNRRLVFDFDDAVFLGGNGKVNTLRRKALDKVFKEAAHVVAGNSWLAEAVESDVPVSVIPTCIDTQYYVPLKQKKENDRIRIGWVGTSGNFPYLWQLETPLATLRSMGYKFDFAICSDAKAPELFRRLGATFEKWTPQGELPFLQSLDIGLMPLADTDWCRGKCSFKMIQYMAVGCPTVASAVGMNIDVLDGDTGGRLVRSGDWVSPLAELIESLAVRRQASLQARRRAIERYDIGVAVQKYKAILGALQ